MTDVAPTKLRLDFAKSHQTYLNAAGQKVPGVTTVLNLLAKPALIAWANAEGLAGRKIDRVSQQAADIGTIAHALVEAHLCGLELDTGNIAPEFLDQARVGFTKWLGWYTSLNPTATVAVEKQMISERLQVGGTLDFGFRCDHGLVLGDGKSSKAIYPEHEIQAAVYADMYSETTGEVVDRVYVVRFGKEANDPLEVREVMARPEKVAAFHALAEARRKLLKTGWKA